MSPVARSSRRQRTKSARQLESDEAGSSFFPNSLCGPTRTRKQLADALPYSPLPSPPPPRRSRTLLNDGPSLLAPPIDRSARSLPARTALPRPPSIVIDLIDDNPVNNN